jgi:hypothetical protein
VALLIGVIKHVLRKLGALWPSSLCREGCTLGQGRTEGQGLGSLAQGCQECSEQCLFLGDSLVRPPSQSQHGRHPNYTMTQDSMLRWNNLYSMSRNSEQVSNKGLSLHFALDLQMKCPTASGQKTVA